MVRPRRSATVLTGPFFLHDDRAAVAMAEIDDLDGHTLRLERDGQRSDDEGGLHFVGDERFLDLGEALEQARNEDLAVVRELGNVVGDRAGELAGDGEIGDADFSLGERAIVVEDGCPVHVQPAVQCGDQQRSTRRPRDDQLGFKTHGEIPSERI